MVSVVAFDARNLLVQEESIDTSIRFGGMPPTAWTRAREREAWREDASRAWPCPVAPLRCAATLVAVPLSSARPPLPGSFPRRLGEARRAVARQRFRHASAAIGGGGGRRWPRRPGGALAAGAARLDVVHRSRAADEPSRQSLARNGGVSAARPPDWLAPCDSRARTGPVARLRGSGCRVAAA